MPSDRLEVTGDGRVRLHLRHRRADGTTHLVFDPIEFLGRLAVLVPWPRINLVLYHGVLGPRATIPAPRPARAPLLPVDVCDGPGWTDAPSVFDADS